ncbi:melanopsin-like [Bolinopsis microptera]|uniref:melanopsin-like n=1 Tax=Bolinopsis microptera TaxID=2820187 RepID=UPI00307A1571
MRMLLVVVNLGVSTGIIMSFSMIMMVIYRQREKRKPSNVFILSMCVTDFMATTIIAPHFVAAAALGKWPSNYLHCKVLAFLNTFLPGMSIMNLILIALDRMVAIFKPTKYRVWLCNRNARIICACFWLYSLSIASLSFWDCFSQPLFDGAVMTCLLTGRKFLILQLSCEVIPGLAATVTCYTFIVIKLMQRSASIYSSGNKASRVNYEIRMAKIGGLVSGFFIMTYLPYYTIMFQYREHMEPLIKLMAGILVVTSYNFDAFMYGYCNKNYRREIKKIVHSKVPWLVKVTPADHINTDTHTNNDTNTMYTNAAANTTTSLTSTSNLSPKQRHSLAPSPIREESETSVSVSKDYSVSKLSLATT